MIPASEQVALRVASLQACLLAGIFTVVGYLRRTHRVEPRETQIELRITEADRARTVRLRPPIKIGRTIDAGLQIEDVHVSRLHALLDVAGERAFIEDLGSRNGTFVNARPIETRVDLAPNDEIRIGGVVITYCGEVPWT